MMSKSVKPSSPMYSQLTETYREGKDLTHLPLSVSYEHLLLLARPKVKQVSKEGCRHSPLGTPRTQREMEKG